MNKINYFSLKCTIVLLGLEILIAIYVKDQWIRPFLGDTLVVLLIYSFLRIWIKHSLKLIMGILLFSFFVEYLQYLCIISLLGLEKHTLLKIIIGSSFDFRDLLTYTLGAIILFFWGKTLIKNPDYVPFS
jgi:hypothetical protein